MNLSEYSKKMFIIIRNHQKRLGFRDYSKVLGFAIKILKANDHL